MHGTRRRRRWAVTGTAAVALGTALAGCTSSDATSSDTTLSDTTSSETTSSGTASPSAAAPTAPRLPASPVGPQDAVRTVVVRDDAGNWPDLLAARLDATGAPMTITADAPLPGSGFTSAPTFAEQVESAAVGSTQLVLVVDSRPDSADADALATAVADLLETVERAAPDAVVIVVGPGSGRPSATLDALRAATEDAGGAYVDPEAEGWPASPSQAQVADLLLSEIRPIAEALVTTGANR